MFATFPRLGRALLLILSVLLVAAACSDSDDAGGEDAGSTSFAFDTEASDDGGDFELEADVMEDTEPDGQAFGSDAEGAAADGVDTALATNAAGQPVDLGRSIIFTATVRVEVDDVAVAAREAQTIVEGVGGLVFGQDTVTEPRARTTLTFRVPPAQFNVVLERLAGVGDLVDQSITADDVTERVVDLRSRITTQEVSVERLRALLESAANLEDIARLEGQLLQRETDLEVLKGQLRTIEDRVDLATITLTISEALPPEPEPGVEVVETAYVGDDAGASCPGEDEVAAEEGDALVVCFEVTNTGNAALTEIEVSDPALRIDRDDVIALEGDPAGRLEPGQRLVLAAVLEADPDRTFSDPVVRAVAVDEAGEPLLRQVAVTLRNRLDLDVERDTSLPGFTDALGGGWDALRWVVGIVVLVVGAVLPFLWVPLFAWLAWRWVLGRRRRKVADLPAPTPPGAATAAADDAEDAEVVGASSAGDAD